MCPRHHSNGFPLGSNGLFPPGGSGGFSSPKPETMFSKCRTVISDFRASGLSDTQLPGFQAFRHPTSGLSGFQTPNFPGFQTPNLPGFQTPNFPGFQRLSEAFRHPTSPAFRHPTSRAFRAFLDSRRYGCLDSTIWVSGFRRIYGCLDSLRVGRVGNTSLTHLLRIGSDPRAMPVLGGSTRRKGKRCSSARCLHWGC